MLVIGEEGALNLLSSGRNLDGGAGNVDILKDK